MYGGRADVLLQPNDQLSIRLNAFAQKIERDGSNAVGYDYATKKPIDGELDQSTILREPFDHKFQLYSATAVYDFGPAALTSVTSYQTLSNHSFLDGSTLFVPTFNFLYFNPGVLSPPVIEFGAIGIAYGIDTDKFTQELRLAGTGPTFDWLIGGFYTHEDSNQKQVVTSFAPDGTPIDVDITTIRLPSTYEEAAGFGTLTWHATSTLDLAAGLRYSHNSQSYAQNTSGITAFLLAPPRPETKSSEDVTTYLANLRYRPNDNLMAYFRFATGYRPGGPNFTGQDPETGEPIGNPAFESDKLQSYEGGIKLSSSDRRFGADAAVYLINWDNMQVVSNRNGVGVVANADTARSTGAEVTLTAVPVPALTVLGTFAYIDAHLTADAPALGGVDGDSLPDTPDFAGTLSGDYGFDVHGHASTVGAAVRYIGDRVSSFDESVGNPQYHLPSYTTVDLRGSAAFGPANLRLYVRNLFDERGQQSASTVLAAAGGPAMISIIQPRTYGMSIDVKF
jgi:outer membrane receptor protein involved in Fe transport